MGTLLNFGSAQGAAQGSIGWDQASTGLGATSAILQGIGGFQQGNYQAQVAANNSKIAMQNAQAASAAGAYEESAQKLRTGLLIGQQKAAQGANGVDVNIGSPAAVRESTATLGAMDAAMIHYNAAREAYGHTVEASNFAAQSKLDSMAARNALLGGFFKAGSTILGGAASIQGKMAQYQLSGATGGMSVPGGNSSPRQVWDEAPSNSILNEVP